MKRFLLVMAAVASLFASCTNDVMSSIKALDERVGKLESTVDQMDKTVNGYQSVINSLSNKNFVVSTQKTSEGYLFTFDNGDTFVIPEVPQAVGIAKEGGVWYWTIDGKTATVDGKKVEVLTTKPTFKYEGEDLYVSYDNGTSWTKVEGKSGSISVTEQDDKVVITTADGKTIEIPKAGGSNYLTLVIVPDNDIPGVTVPYLEGETPVFGSLELSVKVYPAESAASLTAENVKVYANQVAKTKAAALTELTVGSVTARDGMATITVSGIDETLVTEGKTLTVAVEAEVNGLMASSAYLPVAFQPAELSVDDWNFADITPFVTTAEGIEVRKAFGKVSNTPALASAWGSQLPETPFTWDFGSWVNLMTTEIFPVANTMEAQIAEGSWPLVDFQGEAAIVLIDPAKFGAKIVFESPEAPVTISKANAFVSISGTPAEFPLAIYSGGDYVAKKISGWHDDMTVVGSNATRSTLGIKEDGSIEFGLSYNNYGIKKITKSVLWNDQTEYKWADATDWTVKQAVTAYPWVYRTGIDDGGTAHPEGYAMDNWAMLCTDAVQWEPMFGEAWNGNRARSYAGITSDGKIGIATFANVGTYGGAYILHKMGWVDVAQLGTAYYQAEGFTPTIVVDGKVITGNAEATAFYALGFDKK